MKCIEEYSTGLLKCWEQSANMEMLHTHQEEHRELFNEVVQTYIDSCRDPAPVIETAYDEAIDALFDKYCVAI